MCCPRFCARLRPSAVRVRIRSRSTPAKPPNTAIINRPVLVPVSAHGSASDRNCALASTICFTMANRSKVLRAIRYRGLDLPYTTFDKLRQVSQGAIVENKHLGAALAFVREQQRQTPQQRSQKAPRRQGQVNHMFKVG